MSQAISCPCGWHQHGREDEVVDAFVVHVERDHGKQVSREDAARLVSQED